MEVIDAIKAIKALKSGKGAGLDQLQAEHLSMQMFRFSVVYQVCYLMLHLVMDTYPQS